MKLKKIDGPPTTGLCSYIHVFSRSWETALTKNSSSQSASQQPGGLLSGGRLSGGECPWFQQPTQFDVSELRWGESWNISRQCLRFVAIQSRIFLRAVSFYTATEWQLQSLQQISNRMFRNKWRLEMDSTRQNFIESRRNSDLNSNPSLIPTRMKCDSPSIDMASFLIGLRSEKPPTS